MIIDNDVNVDLMHYSSLNLGNYHGRLIAATAQVDKLFVLV